MRRSDTKGFTLTELMVVVAVSLMLISLVGVFFNNLWISSRRAVERTDNNQQILILMQEWQRTINSTDPKTWRINDKGITAGDFQIRQDAEHLVVTSGTAHRRIILPTDAQCAFSLERPEDSSPLAVLSISWLDRRMRSNRLRHARILAHGILK